MRDIWNDTLPPPTNPLHFLWFSIKPFRWSALTAFIFVIIASLSGTAIAYIFKTIVNVATHINTPAGLTLFWHATGAFVLISLMEILLWRGSGLIGMRSMTGVRAVSRHALSSYVTRHSQAYFSDRFAGSISSKISQAAGSAKDIASTILWDFTPFLTAIIASFALAFHTAPPVAFIFLVWVCVITPMNIWLVRKGIPLSSTAQRAENTLGGATVDFLTNITAVHEYAHRPYEISRLEKLIIERRVAGMARWRYSEYVRLLNGILQVCFIGGMITTAAYLVTTGLLTVGDVVLVLTITLLVQDRITYIGNRMNEFGDAWGQITESLSDIIVPYEVSDQSGAGALTDVRGIVTFADMSFSYEGVRIFDNLSLTIPAGQRVGLVGRSGAGKSTLVKLLLRHYDLDSGAICIDGTPIATVTKESLRKTIAVVPQEPLLFHRTIRENISYGNPSATDALIQEAAERAQTKEFIAQLPDGYDSLVGERGIKLSGGQRQRIAIARAMLKDAPILLLDEATSALDSESEIAVQKALLALMENRTVIAIAHRLSTLRAMDRIIVMDKGSIIEDGTHDELIASDGLYAELWAHQAGGFLEE